MKFNENIRNLRREKDYSQEYLAEKLNVTRQTISKWENGAAMPDLKKLTEIADFFNVSMDSLLGIEIEDNEKEKAATFDNNENNYNTEYHKRYTEQLFSIAYQNQYEQNIANHRALKTIAIILSIAIACVILGLILLSNNFESKMSNLQNQINSYNANVSINQSETEDYEDKFEYKFLSINKNKTYIVNTEFRFSPETYPKNASVYLIITNKDSTTNQIDLTEENGIFTATVQIDITAADSGYIYIDDGKIITREELFDGFCAEDFICFSNDYVYDEHSDQYHKSMEDISWEVNSDIPIKITDAFRVTEKNGNENYNEKLKIEEYTDDDNTKWSYVNSVRSDFESEYDDITYLKLIDENKIVYKYYPDDDRTEVIFSDNKIL